MNKDERELLDKVTEYVPFISIRLALPYDKSGYNMSYFNYDQLEQEFKKDHNEFFIINTTSILLDKVKDEDDYYNLFNKLVSEMAERNHYIITFLKGIKKLIKCNKISRSQAVINEL